jgi:hypothetical protein
LQLPKDHAIHHTGFQWSALQHLLAERFALLLLDQQT